MQCPKCSLEISEDSKFCPNCGVNIFEYNESLRAEKYINCPKCKKQIEKGTKFCKHCGVDIENENKLIAEKSEVEANDWGGICGHVILAIIISLFVILLAVILNENNNLQNSNSQQNTYTPPQPTIEVINDRMVNMGYGVQEIQGIVKNTSDTTCFDPYVEIYTFDSAGNRVGEHPVPILNALDVGESYKFTIHVMGATRYEVRSCRCGY